jgi:hypothetical protein
VIAKKYRGTVFRLRFSNAGLPLKVGDACEGDYECGFWSGPRKGAIGYSTSAIVRAEGDYCDLLTRMPSAKSLILAMRYPQTLGISPFGVGRLIA